RRRRRNTENGIEDIGPPQDRRRAIGIGREQQDAGLAEQTPVIGILKFYTPELAATNVRQAIVPRKAFVDVGVRGGEQFGHAAVFAQDAVDEQPQLFLQRKLERF